MTTTHHDTTHHEERLTMGDRLHMPRTRGATTGTLLVLLGIWGGLVPFLGPVFGYAFTPDNAWDFTWGRLWLEIVPAVAVIAGGFWVLGSANKLTGWLGAWLAAAGGAWFVIGQEVSVLWHGAPAAGVPTATSDLGVTAQQIGFFDGLGVVVVFLAAVALGRMSVVGIADVRRRHVHEETVVEDRTAPRGRVGTHADPVEPGVPGQRTGTISEEHRATDVVDPVEHRRRT